MTNELSTERAIEALYTVRAYYASLTAGYPKGKDCRGIGDVMCSEIANSCLMAIKVLEQQSCEDCISRQAVEEITWEEPSYTDALNVITEIREKIRHLPSATPQRPKGKWIDDAIENEDTNLPIQACSICKTFYPLSYTGGGHNYCPNCGAKMEGEENG